MTNMQAHLAPGTVLAGRYEIVRPLAEGGMGTVYLANDAKLQGRLWAVKEMPGGGNSEAQILAKLNHPNLPVLSDFFSEKGNDFLVMEYVEGETLEGVLKAQPSGVSERRLVWWALQICDLLAYLHNQNPPIIYRDLKPDNIIVTRGELVKLIDFGIARHYVGGKNRDTVAIGTPGFAAPEQYGSGQTDARSDIYSLGATLYYLATREDPANKPFQFKPPRSMNPALSPRFSEIITRAVELSPANRFQNVEELTQSLIALESAKTSPSTFLKKKGGGDFTVLEDSLDFGRIERQDQPVSKLQVKVKAGSLAVLDVATDQPWLRASPQRITQDTQVTVRVIGRLLPPGARHKGNVLVSGKGDKETIPILVTSKIAHLTSWGIALAAFLTALSMVPLAGFLGFLGMLSMYWTCPKEERGILNIFVAGASIFSAFWAVVGMAILLFGML
ncbi:MAG: protein kinase [Armatimonadetes bacterium]|nr:protein kinase [Armatimonadota bacterium]